MKTLPFTYLLYCKPLDKYYYGSRYAVNCDPSQLWTSYYTSSKVIKQLILEYGKDAFTFQIRKTFTTSEQARDWEQKFLNKVKAAQSDKWLNKHNGGVKFYNKGTYVFTEQHKLKLSKAQKGKPKPKTAEGLIGNSNSLGNKFSEELKQHISSKLKGNQNRLGIPHTEEAKLKCAKGGIAQKGIPKRTTQCPHCNKIGSISNMKRYHFDNCKHN